jgi:hypothetical protein
VVRVIRRWLGSRWIQVALIWTGLLLLLIAASWPAATTPIAPCGYQGDPNRDPRLPVCPMDAVNYAGVVVVLLMLLWIVGLLVLVSAYAVSRLARDSRRPSP